MAVSWPISPLYRAAFDYISISWEGDFTSWLIYVNLISTFGWVTCLAFADDSDGYPLTREAPLTSEAAEFYDRSAVSAAGNVGRGVSRMPAQA